MYINKIVKDVISGENCVNVHYSNKKIETYKFLEKKGGWVDIKTDSKPTDPELKKYLKQWNEFVEKKVL
jgi:hypothetical protein